MASLEKRIQLFPHPLPQLVLELEDRMGNGEVEEDDLFYIMDRMREEHVGSTAWIVEGKYTPDKKHKIYITPGLPPELPEICRSREYLEKQYPGSRALFLPIPSLPLDEYDI